MSRGPNNFTHSSVKLKHDAVKKNILNLPFFLVFDVCIYYTVFMYVDGFEMLQLK